VPDAAPQPGPAQPAPPPQVLPPEFGGSLDEPHTAWLDERVARERAAAAGGK
jgi:hypothetical protein